MILPAEICPRLFLQPATALCRMIEREFIRSSFFYVHHRYVLLPSAACWISKQSGNEQILLEIVWRGRVKIGSIWGSAWEMFSETNERHRRLLTPGGYPPGAPGPSSSPSFCTLPVSPLSPSAAYRHHAQCLVFRLPRYLPAAAAAACGFIYM